MPASLFQRSARRPLRLALFSTLILGAWPLHGAAQSTPTDAGSVQRELERTRPAAPTPVAAPTVTDQPPAPKPGAATISVKAFRFRGNTLLTEAQLNEALSAWMNKPLDLEGVRSAAMRLQARYEAADRMALVSVGRQDVTEGIVTLDILEARFGQARISETSSKRVDHRRLLAMVAAQMRPGQALDVRAMNRALLLMDDLSGVAVTGSLAAGTKPGETDLVLEVADEPEYSGLVQVDNAGGRAVGREKATAQLAVTSPMGWGDQLLVTTLGTKGSAYGRLAYSLPVGASGLRAQAWATAVDYRVVSRELRDLDAHGRSYTGGASLSYPFIRGREINLNGRVAAESRSMVNHAAGSLASDYGLRNLVLEVSGTSFDGLAGGGANSLTLGWTEGDVDLNGSPNQAADVRAAKTAGRYGKWNLQISRQQVITDDLTVLASLAAQGTSRNLDSSERMGLGGLTGVRAYPSNEGSGSTGQALNLELRHRTADRLVLTAFYDLGSITVYANPVAPGGQSLLNGAPNRYRLSGAGVAANWAAIAGLNLQLTVAQPIGRHPNPSATGGNQDGSRFGTRVWMSASMSF